MYRFVSSRYSVELKKAYLDNYNAALLQKKLVSLLKQYSDIAAVLPSDISAKKLLVGNFKYLTKVYCTFTRYLNGKTTAERTSIIEAFKNGGFNYSSHKRDIAQFLMNPANKFEIHNCVYCDLEDVTTFTKANGKKVRKFDTEHVLDKGECPLVALSLYNFVPSCKLCNSAYIKGTKTIGDTEAEIAKLSPSAEGYDFENKVKFEVKIVSPDIKDLDAIKHAGDYEIAFNVSEPLYQKSIDLFELKSRYNHDKEKEELLTWREKRKKNPDNIVQQFADIRHVTFEEIFEEFFELQKRKHSPMEKARRDIMLM